MSKRVWRSKRRIIVAKLAFRNDLVIKTEQVLQSAVLRNAEATVSVAMLIWRINIWVIIRNKQLS